MNIKVNGENYTRTRVTATRPSAVMPHLREVSLAARLFAPLTGALKLPLLHARTTHTD